jgi:hypothetical protein
MPLGGFLPSAHEEELEQQLMKNSYNVYGIQQYSNILGLTQIDKN